MFKLSLHFMDANRNSGWHMYSGQRGAVMSGKKSMCQILQEFCKGPQELLSMTT